MSHNKKAQALSYKNKTFPTVARKVKHCFCFVMPDRTRTPFSPPTL